MGALAHYIGGSRTTLTQDFDRINTSNVKIDQFPGVKSALDAGASGTFAIDSKKAFDTESLVLGNVTFRLEGTLETKCGGGACAWDFKGTLGAYNDTYDFNRSTHRDRTGEALTSVGRSTPGRAFTIEIRGKTPITGSGTSGQVP